jgi:uncharacterized protein (TIGR02147 family)
MELFETDDYRKIIRKWVASRPGRGRGELLKMSELLGIPSSVFSQTLNGQRDLSPDHALLLADYMGLIHLEKEYFITLVQIQKASHHKYKKYLQEKKDTLKKEFGNLSKRVQHEKTLSEVDQQFFYSSWVYSAIRLKCGIGDGLTAEEIKNQFQLSTIRLNKILEFLVRTGLLIHTHQKYKTGTQSTYISRESVMVSKHHMNWRVRSAEKSSEITNEDLMFTCPLTCSQKDKALIKEKLTATIQEISQIVKDSPSEELVYLGIDWFLV